MADFETVANCISLNPKEKWFKMCKCLIITNTTLRSRYSPFVHFQTTFKYGRLPCGLKHLTVYFPPSNIDRAEIANLSNFSIAYYFLGEHGQALFTRSCHEDVILTRKSHNCAGTAFVQRDSACGSTQKHHKTSLSLEELAWLISNATNPIVFTPDKHRQCLQL